MPLSPVPKRSPSAELLQHAGSDKSSEYLNLSEPPAPSETPDPSSLFPLKRRSSSNYQTALLGDQLRKVDFKNLNATHGKKTQSKAPVNTDPLVANTSENYRYTSWGSSGTNAEESNFNEEEDPSIEQWSPEGSKRYLQRRSTSSGADGDNPFNVQYRGSVSYPPQSTTKESPPALDQSTGGIPRCYHSNQQSPVIEDESKNDYFPRSFEYADFKRRMSKD